MSKSAHTFFRSLEANIELLPGGRVSHAFLIKFCRRLQHTLQVLVNRVLHPGREGLLQILTVIVHQRYFIVTHQPREKVRNCFHSYSYFLHLMLYCARPWGGDRRAYILGPWSVYSYADISKCLIFAYFITYRSKRIGG